MEPLFGRGARCAETASIGTFIHGFSVTGRQHTNTMRAPSLAALRIWAKAATGSPKNITPKFDTSKSYPPSAAVAGSASCQSTLAMPAPSARDLRPLPLRKNHLAKMLRQCTDGSILNDFEQGEIAPTCASMLVYWASKPFFRSIGTVPTVLGISALD